MSYKAFDDWDLEIRVPTPPPWFVAFIQRHPRLQRVWGWFMGCLLIADWALQYPASTLAGCKDGQPAPRSWRAVARLVASVAIRVRVVRRGVRFVRLFLWGRWLLWRQKRRRVGALLTVRYVFARLRFTTHLRRLRLRVQAAALVEWVSWARARRYLYPNLGQWIRFALTGAPWRRGGKAFRRAIELIDELTTRAELDEAIEAMRSLGWVYPPRPSRPPRLRRVGALVDWVRWLMERRRIYRRRGVRLGMSWLVMAIYSSPFHPSAAATRRAVELSERIPADQLQPVVDWMEAQAWDRRGKR